MSQADASDIKAKHRGGGSSLLSFPRFPPMQVRFHTSNSKLSTTTKSLNPISKKKPNSLPPYHISPPKAPLSAPTYLARHPRQPVCKLKLPPSYPPPQHSETNHMEPSHAARTHASNKKNPPFAPAEPRRNPTLHLRSHTNWSLRFAIS